MGVCKCVILFLDMSGCDPPERLHAFRCAFEKFLKSVYLLVHAACLRVNKILLHEFVIAD